MPRTRTSNAPGAAAARARGRRAAPSPARAGHPGGHPEPPGRRCPAPVEPPAVGAAARVRGRGGGLRAADRRGIPRGPTGQGHHRRVHPGAPGHPSDGRFGEPLSLRLPARPARPRRVPARGVAAIDAPRPRRRSQRTVRVPRRAGGAGRAALAAYLDRVRGTCSDPEDIVISAGFSQGLGLIGRVLRDLGVRRVAMEDPRTRRTG